jgi:predicted protein tyrosine phosphatase
MKHTPEERSSTGLCEEVETELEATMKEKKRILFVCGRNRLRSPTAESVFSSHPGIEVASAGIAPDAEDPISSELIEWADLIFVMEKRQRDKLVQKFRVSLKNKQIVILDIPDKYEYMDPELVRLLRRKVAPFLPRQ